MISLYSFECEETTFPPERGKICPNSNSDEMLNAVTYRENPPQNEESVELIESAIPSKTTCPNTRVNLPCKINSSSITKPTLEPIEEEQNEEDVPIRGLLLYPLMLEVMHSRLEMQ